jgi:hypothetical protein
MLASWVSMTKIAGSGSIFVRGIDSRIRIHTKMAWIRNTHFQVLKFRLFVNSEFFWLETDLHPNNLIGLSLLLILRYNFAMIGVLPVKIKQLKSWGLGKEKSTGSAMHRTRSGSACIISLDTAHWSYSRYFITQVPVLCLYAFDFLTCRCSKSALNQCMKSLSVDLEKSGRLPHNFIHLLFL